MAGKYVTEYLVIVRVFNNVKKSYWHLLHREWPGSSSQDFDRFVPPPFSLSRAADPARF